MLSSCLVAPFVSFVAFVPLLLILNVVLRRGYIVRRYVVEESLVSEFLSRKSLSFLMMCHFWCFLISDYVNDDYDVFADSLVSSGGWFTCALDEVLERWTFRPRSLGYSLLPFISKARGCSLVFDNDDGITLKANSLP